MKKTNRKFFLLFFLTIFLQLLLDRTFSSFQINAYPSYICYLVTKFTLIKVSYFALFAGLLLDLQTSSIHFGIHAVIYTVATAFLFKFRHNFFLDKPFGIFLLTITFSLISTVLIALFHTNLHVSFVSAISDFILMPICDGAIGMLLYFFPEKIHAFLKRKHFFIPFFKQIFKTEEYE